MNVTPNTIVKLLSGIPLDNLENTITWLDSIQQANWFSGKAIKSYSDFSYQRYNPNLGKLSAIRIPELVDNIYACNYLMFQNSNYGVKWFYAFVRELNYINDGVTEIIYELDLWQTYFFDITFHPSFIVREHVNNDQIGAHLIPEGLEIGEYKIGLSTNTGLMQPEHAYIGVACTYDIDFNIAKGRMSNYVYNGLNILTFQSPAPLNDFLEQAVQENKIDGIVSIFMLPEFLIDESMDRHISVEKNYESFDGYVPKNNKLYTYPYNYLQVYTGSGTPAIYRYEFFDNLSGNCDFSVDGDVTPNPSILLKPMGYCIRTSDNQKATIATNPGYILSLSGFPQCSWVTDTYKMYLATQANSAPASMISSVLGTALNIGTSIATGNIIGAIGSGLGFATDTLQFVAGREDKKTMAPSSYGSIDNTTAYSSGYRDFWFSCVKITREFAEIIDNYFSMFGYKINKVKNPNIRGRQNWNFVQTNRANITGDIPVEALRLLSDALDKGVTFWHTTDVGNYTLPNNII